ncbi:MAG TPA: isoprenyl transferase [Candidatus Marinimicrobia bacterium]|jgi:undecaprenyl diphosphate synthase|nr:isoprenyl transferase [Candidatus Neomarinimicrobiota bacterium]
MPIKDIEDSIINKNNIPKHIAIIMDGNGRWAKAHSLPRIAGHKEGIDSVRAITKKCGDIGVKHLSLYTFSSENWSRPIKEVKALMGLLLLTIRREIKDLNKNNVRLTTIGNMGDLPDEARKGMEEGLKITENNSGLNLILALSYGGRQEILKMVQSIARKAINGEIEPEKLSEGDIVNELDTAKIPDPDLLIRTGGDQRISNFLLWQIAYSEIYVTDTYWPEFKEKELLDAVADFQDRERRFGRISEQLDET